MKRKGFTLIELLAVIVILSVIGLITIPIIGNIIEDSKKKALEQSVYGIVEAANYFALENTGEHHFIVSENNTIESTSGKLLSYKGQVDAEGELYIDNDGNISLCVMNDKYYVYKNYNGGIYIGNVSDDTCIIGHDAITNKYVAMLDDGTGTVNNVYSKSEVDSLVTNLQSQITSNNNDINTLSTLVDSHTTNIVSMQKEIDELKSNSITISKESIDITLSTTSNAAVIGGVDGGFYGATRISLPSNTVTAIPSQCRLLDNEAILGVAGMRYESTAEDGTHTYLVFVTGGASGGTYKVNYNVFTKNE